MVHLTLSSKDREKIRKKILEIEIVELLSESNKIKKELGKVIENIIKSNPEILDTIFESRKTKESIKRLINYSLLTDPELFKILEINVAKTIRESDEVRKEIEKATKSIVNEDIVRKTVFSKDFIDELVDVVKSRLKYCV